MLELVAGPGGTRLAAIEEATRRRFFLVPAEGHIHTDHFDVVAEGKLLDLQPVSQLVEGATVELKLGEVGRYDATWAAGKVDGVDVLVAGAAKLVGKKATVTIGRVLEGQAFATLVASGEAGEGPITFESEAEKPTRAPARRKVTAPADGEEPSLDEVDDASVEELDPGHDIDVEEGGEAEDVADATEDGELAAERGREASRGSTERRPRRSGRAAAHAAAAAGASLPAPGSTRPAQTTRRRRRRRARRRPRGRPRRTGDRPTSPVRTGTVP